MQKFVFTPESQRLLDQLANLIDHEDIIIMQEARDEHERLVDELTTKLIDLGIPDEQIETLVYHVSTVKKYINDIERRK